MTFNVTELPYLTLWKNTASKNDGYVTGIEPGTSYPYNRRIERNFGRVPVLEPGESRTFEIQFSVLRDGKEVQEEIARIDRIQDNRTTELNSSVPDLD